METCFNVFQGATNKILNNLYMAHKDQPDVVKLHISSIDINNQTKGKINTEILTQNKYNQHW